MSTQKPAVFLPACHIASNPELSSRVSPGGGVYPAPLYVVGLGPGDSLFLAPEAAACLEASKVIVGYIGYISLLSPDLLEGRRIISTGMMGEMARSEAAIDAAMGGEPTAVVCSGDPGIYALAGLVLEILEQRGIAASELPLQIVPGIPAVCAAAALLGAPLMHDFACISLSDLLTPWETIQLRLSCAFQGDFVVAVYNPRSKRRTHQLEDAIAAALKYRSPETPVGVVQNACRIGQQVDIVPLGKFDPQCVDMFTLLIIGNSSSRIVPGKGDTPLAWESGARMLTPRGYMEKYKK